jgi:hypothetical protein
VKLIIVAYDRASSGISSYTVELAKLLSGDMSVTLLSFDELNLPSVNVVRLTPHGRSAAFPLLTFLRNEGEVRKALESFDVVHETLPPWGSVAENLVTTRWGYVSHLRLALIRLTGLSFPYNLGAFPVTF